MLAAFGVDVLDQAVSLRRVHVLLQRLPPHARRGGEAWSVESELLAGVIDHLANLSYIVLRGLGATSAAQPKPLPRPGQRQPETRAGGNGNGGVKHDSWNDLADAFARMPGVTVE